MPVADETCFENWMAPVFFLCPRKCRAYEPTRFRRAGLWLRAETQEKSRDGFLRAGQCQPTAGHQIEDFRLARNLDHDGTQRRTGERIICRTKAIRRIGHAEQEQAGRIQAKFEKSCR